MTADLLTTLCFIEVGCRPGAGWIPSSGWSLLACCMFLARAIFCNNSVAKRVVTFVQPRTISLLLESSMTTVLAWDAGVLAFEAVSCPGTLTCNSKRPACLACADQTSGRASPGGGLNLFAKALNPPCCQHCTL